MLIAYACAVLAPETLEHMLKVGRMEVARWVLHNKREPAIDNNGEEDYVTVPDAVKGGVVDQVLNNHLKLGPVRSHGNIRIDSVIHVQVIALCRV